MIDHNHFICHFIFGGHLLNIPKKGCPKKTASFDGFYSALKYFMYSS